MDKKKKVKHAAGCMITIGLTVALLAYSSGVAQNKISDFKYMPFFEQEEDFDILFIGTSHVINGIFPMELWHDYGMVSYNFGGDGNRIATSYWVMENAFDYTTPKLVVIDCYGLSETRKIHPEFAHLHPCFDAFPLSKTKVRAVFDLLDGKASVEETTENGTRTRSGMELIWDYSIYHSRWNEVGREDYIADYTKEKGAVSRIKVGDPVIEVREHTERKLEEDTVSVEYLEKMIADCQEREIEVLLTYLPMKTTETEQLEANRVYDIAGQYGVNYINFLDLDIVRGETDYYNGDHLNPSGARKITDYIGQYIADNYSIPDHREDKTYENWYADYEDYAAYKLDNLKNCDSLDNYLMLLADKNYVSVIEMKNPDIWNSAPYDSLLENAGAECKKAEQDMDIAITVMDKETEQVIDQCSFSFQYPTKKQ